MAAARWDIVIEEESEFDFYVTLYDSECVKKNIDGWGALFQVRKERSAESPVLYERTSADTIYVQPDEAIGLVHIKMFVSQVNNPAEPFTEAYWDLLMWPADGEAGGKSKRIVEGKVRWSPAVSRGSEND
jgi:hypothetical protein